MPILEYNHYGKGMVRVLRVQKDGDIHSVSEWETYALVEGGQEANYLSDDNSAIVPTDTVKNTVTALAHDLEDVTRDGFALAVAKHFVTKYAHLTACDTDVSEKTWIRYAPAGKPHPHTFIRDSNGRFYSKARYEKDGGTVKRSAGVKGFVIMKTTESGFVGYPVCEYTTLQETTDRIFSTSLDAEWEYIGDAADLDQRVIDSILEVFAGTYSPSVQRTMYQMGEAVLAACPGIARIKFTMPNKHYLNIDLTKLGRPEGQKKVFLPTDDPFGYIEAVIARDA